MKKYYFALFCALMAATSAMAAPQSGDRIVAAQVHAVEWNDAAFRPIVDEAAINVGLNAQLTPSEDKSVLILSGLCDLFNIPVHVDDATGKAWIETGMPLDAYIDKRDDDQLKRDVVRTIYALPEQCLADADADMNANLYGSVLEDGSIAFDGGIVFLVSESTAVQDLATAGDASEAVWMSSPLFSDICLLVPNAIHQFRVDNDPDMSLLIPKKPFFYLASMQAVRVNFGLLEEQGFKPRNPNGPPPVCNPGSGNNGSAATSDGQSADGRGTLNAVNLVVTSGYDLRGGFKKKKKDEMRPCSDPRVGNLVLKVATRTPGGQIARIRPFDGNGFSDMTVLLDSAGRRPVPPSKPRPCRPDGSDEVGRLRPNSGGNVYAPNHDNDNIEAGYKPKKRPPVNGCSNPWVWIMTLESLNSQLPTRFGPNPNVASSKSDNEEFSVPVYVFQNPDDNTITVYNLYGSGCVTTCMIVPEERKMSIADVTELIDHLLTAGNDDANQVIDDVNQDGKINIDDVTTLIDTLLNAAN